MATVGFKEAHASARR